MDEFNPMPTSLAVVTVNDDKNSSVSYQLLNADIPRHIANVAGFHYIPDYPVTDNRYIACSKPIINSHKALEKVVAFLGGNKNGRTSKVAVGESVIVEYLENGGKETQDVAEVMVYHETKWSHPLHASDETQFITLRSSSLKSNVKIEDISSVNISSGICLFSQEHLGCLCGESAALPNSEFALLETPPPSINWPTMYEIESLVRLSNTIANVVSTLPASLDVTITLDIPRVQYYAFQLDLYARGLCSRESVNSWLETIDKRHDQLASVFQTITRDALHRRGVDRDNVKIELSSGLELLVPYIRKAIDHGNSRALSVENLLQQLLANDPLFREHYNKFQSSTKILVDLCFASYTFQLLRPVFQRDYESRMPDVPKDSVKRQLLINIDNTTESRIYSQAEKILKEYQKKKHHSGLSPLLIGMFPRELVFTALNTGRTSLYVGNIGHSLYDGPEGTTNTVNPSDVVAEVYGAEVTRSVVGRMMQEGMFEMSSKSAISDESSSSDRSLDKSDGEGLQVSEWDSSDEPPKRSKHRLEGCEKS